MGRNRWVVIVVALVAIAWQGSAHAQVDGVQRIVTERSGWFFGASIGRGELNIDVGCSTCPKLKKLEEALSLSGHAGMLLNPRLGVVVEGWMVRFHDRDNLRFADSSDHTISETMLLGSAQVWAGRLLWLRAGLGFAWHETDLKYPVDGRVLAAAGGEGAMTRAADMAPAGAVTLGIEAAHTPGFALDIALRLGGAAHDRDVDVGMMALTVGGSWY